MSEGNMSAFATSPSSKDLQPRGHLEGSALAISAHLTVEAYSGNDCGASTRMRDPEPGERSCLAVSHAESWMP